MLAALLQPRHAQWADSPMLFSAAGLELAFSWLVATCMCKTGPVGLVYAIRMLGGNRSVNVNRAIHSCMMFAKLVHTVHIVVGARCMCHVHLSCLASADAPGHQRVPVAVAEGLHSGQHAESRAQQHNERTK